MTPEMLTDRTNGIHQVDTATTNQVLAAAVAERSVAQVRADYAGWELVGSAVCVGEDGPHLVLQLERADRQTQTILESSPLQLSMKVAGAQYCFETRSADQTAGAEPGVVRVLRPTTIALTERRRSPRRRLRRPTDVTLQAVGSKEGWHCTAAMLNLSLEGIACRMPVQDAGLLHIGQTLRAHFRLAPSGPALALNARIVSITKGGTLNHLVIGLEFIVDRTLDASRTTLRDALEITD